ncbi:MAG: amino acid racemase [Candidatus Aenigmatarchaeota archaeon]|nr:MAG: amino acid racemase [Candidatus Aenigmarchaeota archaeon]
MKVIGIMGGMGPVATEELYRRIIQRCQREYNAIQDADYPDIVLYSKALEGTDETGITDADLAYKEFIEGITKLQRGGADFIIIPCNTLHTFIMKLRQHLAIPVLDMTEETAKRVSRAGLKKVGLLASESAYASKMYDSALKEQGVFCMTPTKEDIKALTAVILNVMGGNESAKDKKTLLKIVGSMVEKGAEAVIVGCTELSVILRQDDTETKLFDALQIIAEDAVTESKRYA